MSNFETRKFEAVKTYVELIRSIKGKGDSYIKIVVKLNDEKSTVYYYVLL